MPAMLAARPASVPRKRGRRSAPLATQPARGDHAVMGIGGYLSVLSESPGALRSALNQSGWIDQEVIAAGQLRQGKAPTTLGMITGHALIEVARPRRSKS